AGAGRRDHVLGVEGGRAEDLDRVDLWIGEQRVEIGVGALDPPFARPALEHLGARIAQRDHVAILVREVARHVERRDIADTDDPDPYSVHYLPFSMRLRASGLDRPCDVAALVRPSALRPAR